jgi:IS30 family transposase
MFMNTPYTRLRAEEREMISRGLSAGWTLTQIATITQREVSTVSREVEKNCRYRRCYRALGAQRRAVTIRHQPKQLKKLDQYPALRDYVFTNLRQQWSPEEIAKRLPNEYPDNITMRISHESIYTYIYILPRGSLRKELITCLRQERNLRRNRKQSHTKRSTITNAISITERPAEVTDRTVPGHWEGDLLMGSKASNSAVGTLVERVTRYLLLVPLPAHDAQTVRQEFAKAVQKIPRHLKRSLTYDRGTEMTEHELFTKETKIQVYFANPYSPWQRGTNENTNGLLRQYFPKGIDFRTVTRQEIRRVQNRMNDRPRKVLEFLKPNEVFHRLLTYQKIALEG